MSSGPARTNGEGPRSAPPPAPERGPSPSRIRKEGGSVLMVIHRRAGIVVRVLRLRSPKVAVPAPRRPGIELVDAHSAVRHRVRLEELPVASVTALLDVLGEWLGARADDR